MISFTEQNEKRPMALAINKFLYFSWNYEMTEVEYNERTLFVPKFIKDVNWTFGKAHAVDKWQEAVKCTTDAMAYVPRFYSALDTTNRRRFIDYIIDTYNGELSL